MAEESSGLRIRAAERRDLAALVRLLADDDIGRGRERMGETLHPGYVAAFEQIDADPHDVILVAEQDGELVGTLQLTMLRSLARRGSRRAQVEAVRVAGDRRGEGIGRRLMDEAVTRARAADCRVVQLTSDRRRDGAIAFYERLGFVPSHVGFKLLLDPAAG